MNLYFILGCVVWATLIFLLFALRPKAWLHSVTMEDPEKGLKVALLAIVPAIVVLICILPMGLCPKWNGEIPEHRNQYEVMAESVLNGHVYLDYEVDPKLTEMENPYDFEQRDALGVAYHWDHAFYNGHYYMYFGVVPVFLLFLPYRVITGENLTTYHATQIFAAIFIVGIFALFYLLAKKFFPKMTLGMYLMLSTAFSIASIWYSVGMPALYATAGTAGVSFQVWSLFFFVKAVWDTKEDGKSIFYMFLGSLLGALTFGCRPPIALANLLVIPLLVKYLRGRKIDRKLVKDLIIAALPYAVIGILLMLYNYVRFENPFEFGQAYQLTVTDQSGYGSVFSKANIFVIINGLYANFISYLPISDTFPYISYNGALVNFPIFLFSAYGLSQGNVRKELKNMKLWGFVMTLLFMPVLITIVDALWAPSVYERCRIDIYWLMGILCFIMIGYVYGGISETAKKKLGTGISLAALITVFTCFFLWAVPMDWNLTQYYPWVLENIKRVIRLGLFFS